MNAGVMTSAYIAASVLFILSLGGLSHQETAKRGNLYGMLGMAIAIVATIGSGIGGLQWILVAMVIGGAVGSLFAARVQMTSMPELVAIMHSFVGLAAVLVGYGSFLDPVEGMSQKEHLFHGAEIYLGIFIGAVTFSGSVIAFGKLHGMIHSKPLALPARHWLNLAGLLACVWLGIEFLNAQNIQAALLPLGFMTVIALLFGIHMVMAIGGADMPVVISMLNSYSGWAAAAAGFMLSNDLLIVTGALVGSSGAILSYIMCQAMNRNFFSVIMGGFGSAGAVDTTVEEGEIQPTSAIEVAELLDNAENVIIVPGYGMAVAHAQHTVSAVTHALRKKGVNVRFAIHPVAGRMPGHMNVLLAEAKVPYDIVMEMDEINQDFLNADVVLVIGANDIVNPSALENPNSPIAGMPVLEVWNAKRTVVLKRSMATGYAGVENPLFFRDNTHMLFGDARESVDTVLKQVA
ncbi:MAG: Re/Si-specific NAD(P)(+) transhydrogenase subunit beta [Candidatus Thiodiazotropha sp. (ex Lucinoma borealis)]|nr:Re/Si-specific NAD(P)(+) transhydrogenase subunit beta [Candidatus Thiodiazotropha sp. (ex Lucinoma borealis)]